MDSLNIETTTKNNIYIRKCIIIKDWFKKTNLHFFYVSDDVEEVFSSLLCYPLFILEKKV